MNVGSIRETVGFLGRNSLDIYHLNGLQFGTSCQVHVQGLGEYCRFEFDSQKVTNNEAF